MDVEDIERFVEATGPGHSEIQSEMADYAEEHGFPIIGPGAGGVLQMLARLTRARRVFEFGSGYGYSATWFLSGMPDAGEVILTEFDAEELDMAREFFERAGLSDRATFEEGDAVSIVDDHEGPFDLVLIDHQKHRYAEAFENVRAKVPPGGAIVADNIVSGPVDFDALLAHVADGESIADADEHTRGIADYLATVRGDPDFETVVLPVSEGIAVSVRIA